MKRLIGKLRRAWKSWTVNWGALLMVAGYFQDNIGQVLPLIKKYVPDENVGGLLMVVGLVVVLLRIKTTKPLGDR